METSGSKLLSKSELITVARAALFLMVAICLMGPLASDTLFPYSPDHPNHAAAIVQARQAIDEGQFPLRIAPWQHGGLRYPQFQFYSWVPHWVGGLLHKYFFADNPWTALKWVYLLALWLAGMCMHSAFRRLDLSEGASLAGSFVYVTAPYLLTNTYSRGAFTEVIAQTQLTLAFWGLVNILHGSSRRLVLGFAAVSFSVYLLANTHIITFAYGLFFLIIFSGILLAIRALSLLRAGILAAAIIAGCLLAAHQLIPILTASELAVRALLPSPMALQRFSPLGIVMSLGPAAPYLASGDLPNFWPQAGLPTLSAACLAVFLLVTDPIDRAIHKLTLCAALACLVLSILTASATIDIWRLLPSEAHVLQFPYRLMTFAALFGAIVAGISAHIGEPKYKSLPMGVVAVALLSAAIWHPKMERNGRTVAQVLETPDLGYGSATYLVSKAAVFPNGMGPTINGPAIHSDGWLNLAARLHFSAAQLRRQPDGVLLIAGRQVADAKGCAELHVKVGANTIVVPAKMTEFIATVSAHDLLQAAGGATEFEVGFDSPCASVPGPHDPRRLFMFATEVGFLPNSSELSTVLRADTGNMCNLKGAVLQCEVQSAAPGEIQLPVLYYPNLLSVKVNGTETSIKPVEKNEFVLTRVALPAGKSTVTAEFVGSIAGNYISLAGFLCWVIGIPLGLKRFADRKDAPPPGGV